MLSMLGMQKHQFGLRLLLALTAALSTALGWVNQVPPGPLGALRVMPLLAAGLLGTWLLLNFRDERRMKLGLFLLVLGMPGVLIVVWYWIWLQLMFLLPQGPKGQRWPPWPLGVIMLNFLWRPASW